jgi:predicted GNAT family acetyltransferase
VFGPAQSAAAFADAWCALDPDRRITDRSGLILYRCDASIPPAPVPGAARAARAEDALLMIPWARAFERDVGDPPAADTEARVSRLCEDGDLFIWEVDDVPVSMAAIVRRAAHTASIGYVYTPRAARRRGFAAAITADVTQRLLDAGLAYTNLFTAATNATTNHIYPAIGYTRVSDYLDVSFGAR